jgi:hypothetical protein
LPRKTERGIEGLGITRVVPTLKETRALAGFSRLTATVPNIEMAKGMLRRKREFGINDWLPAYVVRGEGIYIELDLDRLREWETAENVVHRSHALERRLLAANHPPLANRLGSRYFLLHTLAHALINTFVLQAGYSSASLRERIFCGPTGTEMAGILIYTAAGDSDGTLGGLVRLGETNALRDALQAAVARAAWCANDPVCMELSAAGQGHEGCNGAACHSCSLLPETSCEDFNRALDRAFLVGTLEDPGLGFFSRSLDPTSATNGTAQGTQRPGRP